MASLKKHIEEYCKSCTYDHTQSGTWRFQVEQCSAKTCKLWPVRPLTMETIIANRTGGKVIPIEVDVDKIIGDLEDDDEETEDSSDDQAVA